MKIKKVIILLLVSFFSAISFSVVKAGASDFEHIENFNSVIEVKTNGYINVTEKIQAFAMGYDIIHGIYRDIPTKYWKNGLPYNVDLNILSIKKDGVSEPYFTSDMNNGTRIYIGDKDVDLSTRYYYYEIQYEMGPMVGYFDNYDEIYQNITGNGWEFLISHTTAKIILPTTVDESVLKIDAYTGVQGDKGTNFTSSVSVVDGKTVVKFKTNTYLLSKEGLTVSVGFPKGIIEPQSPINTGLRYFISALPYIIPLGLLIVLLVYYFIAWIIAGRDAKGKLIIPLYSLSNDLSPMTMRLIDKMSYDSKAVVSGIMNLGVKGLLEIKEIDKTSYKITATNKVPTGLTSEESKLYELIGKSLTIKHSYSKSVYDLYKSMGEYLDDEGKKYFSKNYKYLIFPILLISLICGFTIFNGTEETFVAIFWNAIVIPMFFWYYIPSLREIPKISCLEVLLILYRSCLFFGFALIGLIMIFDGENIFLLTIFLFAIIITCIFQPIMKARTILGREKQDEIEGFKMFLKTTEPNKLKVLYPEFPYSITTYEKYLPFCIAIGLEGLWSQKFADLISKLPDEGVSYHPMWYIGTNFSGHSFSSGFSSSISGSIAASSTAPGSSSGGGGGGSSGGGGGGGGGGGW